MIRQALFLAFAYVGLTSALFFKQEKWDGLSVTWGVNPFSSDVFSHLPRTAADAEKEGWTQLDGGCDAKGKFRGRRYWKDNDPAVIVLFDVNNFIAGIQCGIIKTSVPATYPPMGQRGNIFQDDGARWTLTAYFSDPASICTTGRTADEFDKFGTGTVLLIQNGSDPVTQRFQMPATEPGMAGTSWKLGHCFPAMGDHYWYNVTEDMSCDDFLPVFALYNQKELTAFGWAVGTHLTSPRFEHPPASAIGAFMEPVPTCLVDGSHQQSTMHIYMTAHPTRDLC